MYLRVFLTNFFFLCQVKSGTIFDNVLVTDSVDYAETFAKETLDASVSDNSVQLLNKLGWIPVDNIIRLRKLCIMHKIIKGKCPNYLTSTLFL